DGMWAMAYEKTIGTIYLERQKTQRHVTPLAIIGVGGSPATPLELFTGHTVQKWSCKDFQTGKLSASEREQKLAELREQLAACVADKRLMVGGTAKLGGSQTVVPGLLYNHSYGVLGYDKRTDTVAFWNPIGSNYTPKGPPGLKHGFVTHHGCFSMPLTDAVMWFGSFSIETDEPSTRFEIADDPADTTQ
ncbi:MAG TPA: hypothetical protein VG713_12495, partial [Pirellulales bacterium]|nr:hypothetical protein [Pirellulales bacterium]